MPKKSAAEGVKEGWWLSALYFHDVFGVKRGLAVFSTVAFWGHWVCLA